MIHIKKKKKKTEFNHQFLWFYLFIFKILTKL